MSNKNKGIRIFLALDLDEEVKDTLEDTQFDLMEMVPEETVNWVDRQQFHLTLFFVGDNVLPDQVAQLCTAVEEIGRETRPFGLKTDTLGCFPAPDRPRVLWVGVDGHVPALHRLKKRVDEKLQPLGWSAEDRRYTPHLTLGRVRKEYEVGRANLPYGSPITPASWTADALHVYHSRMTKHGIEYTKVHSGRFLS